MTVQNNDIGPCGVEDFQQWSDGISFSCQNGMVQNNMINNPTDGGIVLFGSPGTIVQNNSIWIEEVMLTLTSVFIYLLSFGSKPCLVVSTWWISNRGKETTQMSSSEIILSMEDLPQMQTMAVRLMERTSLPQSSSKF